LEQHSSTDKTRRRHGSRKKLGGLIVGEDVTGGGEKGTAARDKGINSQPEEKIYWKVVMGGYREKRDGGTGQYYLTGSHTTGGRWNRVKSIINTVSKVARGKRRGRSGVN